MHILFAFALSVLALGAVFDSAQAQHRRSHPIVVYDYEPGVHVRAYWTAPWRNRRYFPTTGEKPELGRDEDLTAPRDISEPAQNFYRSWSTSSAFIYEDLNDPLARGGKPGQNDLPPLSREDDKPPPAAFAKPAPKVKP
jgi:hypothetical protein